VVDGGPFAAEHALATTRGVLRRRTLTNQGGTIHLTPGTYEIEQVVRLTPDRTDAVRDHYWRLVRHRCGERTVEQTWLVLVGLTQAQLVPPAQRFLVAPTTRGWRVAYESY
jgi:hypothetical protein